MSPSSTAILRVGTWNLRFNNRRACIKHQVDYLADQPWDVLCIQEVNPHVWAALRTAGLADGAVDGLEIAGGPITGRWPHSVGILVRNGLTLTSPVGMPGSPHPRRGVGAVVDGWTIPVSVASWHAPNAASNGPAMKMQGYLAFLGWIARQRGAVAVGFDSNHWEESIDLDIPMPTDYANGWFLENRFFGAEPPHRLRDAFRDHLRRNPGKYRRLLKTVPPDGPLAHTYTRGSRKNPRHDRFDYVFISEDFVCTGVEHDYDGAHKTGSDHAFVLATLELA